MMDKEQLNKRAVEPAKIYGIKQKSKYSFLHRVVICVFYTIGIACGLALYFDYSKGYGLGLVLVITPALILNYIEMIKRFIKFNKKH